MYSENCKILVARLNMLKLGSHYYLSSIIRQSDDMEVCTRSGVFSKLNILTNLSSFVSQPFEMWWFNICDLTPTVSFFMNSWHIKFHCYPDSIISVAVVSTSSNVKNVNFWFVVCSLVSTWQMKGYLSEIVSSEVSFMHILLEQFWNCIFWDI